MGVPALDPRQGAWGHVIPVVPEGVVDVYVQDNPFVVVLPGHIASETRHVPEAVDDDLLK